MDCSLNGATGANSTVLLLIAAAVLCCGAVVVAMSRRKAPAVAAAVFAFVAIGVGGAAGGADAAAESCAGFPVCLQNPSSPFFDTEVDTVDGVHLIATIYSSTNGSCSGDSEGAGTGAIADTEAEAEAICGTDVLNLNATALPFGITPLPPLNWWACVSVVITPGP